MTVKDRIQNLARRAAHGDNVAHLVTLAFASLVLLLTVLLVVELTGSSALSRARLGWQFLWTSNWDPVAEDFGALPFIYGTLVTSFLALLLAVPVGVGAALFLSELASRK